MTCLRDILTTAQIEMLYKKYGGVEWTDKDKIAFLEDVNELVDSEYITKVIEALKTPLAPCHFSTPPTSGKSYYESELYKLMLIM